MKEEELSLDEKTEIITKVIDDMRDVLAASYNLYVPKNTSSDEEVKYAASILINFFLIEMKRFGQMFGQQNLGVLIHLLSNKFETLSKGASSETHQS